MITMSRFVGSFPLLIGKIAPCYNSLFLVNHCTTRATKSPAEDLLIRSGSHQIRVSNDRIEKYVGKLRNFGFSETQSKDLIFTEPRLLNVKLEDFSSIFLNWCTFKMPDNVLLKSLSNCPKLLLMDKSDIEKRTSELMGVFTQKDIVKIIKTCPNVFIENFDMIRGKVEYIVHRMGIEQKSIIKAGALKCDLKFIALRHNFLVCAGKYKKPGKKVLHNPPLAKILSSNIDSFLKLTNCTKEEYDVFCDMFEEFFDEIDYSDDDEMSDNE